MDKVDCIECGTKILPTTAKKTDGKCMPCSRGVDKNAIFKPSITDEEFFGSLFGNPLEDKINQKKSETDSYFLPKNAFLGLTADEAFLKMSDHTGSLILLLGGIKPYLKPKHNESLFEAFALIDLCVMFGSGGVSSYFNSSATVHQVLPPLKVLLPEELFKHFQFAVGLGKRDKYAPLYEFREHPLIKKCKGNRQFKNLEYDCYFKELEQFVDVSLQNICGQYFLDNRTKYEES